MVDAPLAKCDICIMVGGRLVHGSPEVDVSSASARWVTYASYLPV
jgi:hypothetical protein